MKRAVWIAIGIASVALLVDVLTPTHHHGESSSRVKCASNLRQIGTGLLLYANEHGGVYPGSFKTVLRTEDLVPEVFVCHLDDATPAASVEAFTGTPADCSYLYYGDGVTSDASDDVILAFEQLDNHDYDGINVLFGDGHAEFVQISRPRQPVPPWWKDVEDQIARHARPIRLPKPATQPAR